MSQEELSFATVMRTLYSGLSRGTGHGQQSFLHAVFEDFEQMYSSGSCFERMHITHISKLMTGGDIPSRLVAEHYFEKKEDQSFENHLEEKILPLLLDADNTINSLRNRVQFDPCLSQHKREELLANYGQNARFVAAVIRYVLESPSQRQQKTDGIDLRSLFRGYRPPKPCKTFVGREREVQELNTAIQEHKKVWVSGFPGMGKSETVKAFAQEYAYEYREMLWINCSQSVKHSIASLILDGVNPGGMEEERFFFRDRLLRMLTDQSILFLDNVNWDVAEDAELQVMLNEYPCKVVVISRNADGISKQVTVDVLQTEEERFQLFKTFFPKADEHKSTVKEIMACVGHHTMAMEMAARLLGLGAAEPQELLERLKRKNLLDDTRDTFAMEKDRRKKRDTYKGFIRQLFALHDLDGYEKQILCCLALMPAEGIEIVLFKQLLRATDGNAIHRLVDKGLILFDSGKLSLQPLMLETVLTELKPSIGSCSDMISQFTFLLRMQWHSLLDHHLVEAMVETLIRHATADGNDVFLDLLHAAYEYADKHGLLDLKNMVFYRLYREIAENGNGTEQDKVLCYLECANRVTDAGTQLRCCKAAYDLMKNGAQVSAEIRFGLLSQYGMLLYQFQEKDLAQDYLTEAADLVLSGQIAINESVVQTIILCITEAADAGDISGSVEALKKLYQDVAAIDAESALLADINLAAANVYYAKKDYRSALAFAEQALSSYRVIHGVDSMAAMETQECVNDLRQKCEAAVGNEHNGV